MRLSDYLQRIGYDGPVRPDLQTLKGLHRAHLMAIPYEALDVQLGKSLTTDPRAAYAKIVEEGRGGWCYEMNGLFGWALSQVGFKVTRLCTGPMRPYAAERELGNHLVNRVDLEEGAWLADVGFGDGPIEPYPLVEGEFTQRRFTYRLEKLDQTWWRLNNHEFGMAPAYDFSPSFSDEGRLSERCRFLNTADESPFRLNLVALRHTENGLISLVGRKLRRLEFGMPKPSRLMNSAEEMETVLRDDFGIRLPTGVRELWPRVCARHEELFGATA